jgi:hypothetical protein
VRSVGYIDEMNFRGGFRNISYWTQYVLLTFFGPAQQSEETDPIAILKRKYGKSKDK